MRQMRASAVKTVPLQKEASMMKVTKNLGMLLLAIWLIEVVFTQADAPGGDTSREPEA